MDGLTLPFFAREDIGRCGCANTPTCLWPGKRHKAVQSKQYGLPRSNSSVIRDRVPPDAYLSVLYPGAEKRQLSRVKLEPFSSRACRCQRQVRASRPNLQVLGISCKPCRRKFNLQHNRLRSALIESLHDPLEMAVQSRAKNRQQEAKRPQSYWHGGIQQNQASYTLLHCQEPLRHLENDHPAQ